MTKPKSEVVTQCILVPKSKTKNQAVKIARALGGRVNSIQPSDAYWRFRQLAPDQIDPTTYKTVTKRGVKILTGVRS